MDPELRRERERFLKRAKETPTIENKIRREEGPEAKKRAIDKPGPSPQPSFKVPSSSSSGPNSAYKFGILTKIVKHLKTKFQEGEDSPLSVDEILDETNQLDVNNKIRMWLVQEAFPNNPKIERTEDDKYVFKPPLRCRDKKSLLRLLRLHDMKGLGGIFRDDVLESVPHAERILKALDPEMITISRQDKKKVLFYRDKTSRLNVDEEFTKLWRSVAVDGIDDQKIEEYLEKQGIRSMEGHGLKKSNPKLRKTTKKKTIRKIKDNEHIASELKHYE